MLPPDVRQMGSQLKQAAIQNAVQTATGVIDQRLPPQIRQLQQLPPQIGQIGQQLQQPFIALQQKEAALQQCLGMLRQYQVTHTNQ